MPRGDSGRIVLEIDPLNKQALYSAVTRDGLTLKDWFLARANEYLRNKDQLQLFKVAESTIPITLTISKNKGPVPYRKKKKKK